MNKLIAAVAVTALFSFSSCMQDEFSQLSGKASSTNLEDLQISSEFNWSTSKTISVKVLGFPTEQPIQSTLKISAGNNVYYTGLHAVADTLNLSIDVPATVRELTLTMGTIKCSGLINGSTVQFSYLAPSVNL